MKIYFKKLTDTATAPKRETPMSAGYDLYAANTDTIDIPVGEIRMIPIGISARPEREDVAMMIFPRSGIASKYGITLANSVGVVDADYRGEIKVPLINHGKETFSVETGMRIAQLVVMPYLTQEWVITDVLDETERGEGSFGSTGIKK